MTDRKSATIIGGGVIGGGWAARFLLSGWDAIVFDPNPEARIAVNRTLERARASYPALYDKMLPAEGQLRFAKDLPEAVAGSSWIQESVTENADLKRSVYDQIQSCSAAGTIIASSTSGFKPTDLQAGARRPEEIIVAHPFNPVYLLPAVEVVPSDANSDTLVGSAVSTLSQIGMFPLELKTEIDAHLGDRFLEAVWREALWLIKDDIANTREVDEIIRMGFGLRWAQMGLFETYRIAGGSQGMKHFLEQFGPCLSLPWTRLTDVPELDAALIEKIASQSDEQSGHLSIAELDAIRDANLVTMLRGLKARNWGAGSFLRECEARVTGSRIGKLTDVPITTIERIIPPDWVDYNGHMNEARYLEIFSLATDGFLEIAGCDQDYVATGGSYFTLETNIRHLNEVFAGQPVRVDTWCLFGQGKKLHLYHALKDLSGAVVATGEHLLLHIDLSTRRSSDPGREVAASLETAARAHAGADLPCGAEPKLSFNRSRGTS